MPRTAAPEGQIAACQPAMIALSTAPSASYF